MLNHQSHSACASHQSQQKHQPYEEVTRVIIVWSQISINCRNTCHMTEKFQPLTCHSHWSNSGLVAYEKHTPCLIIAQSYNHILVLVLITNQTNTSHLSRRSLVTYQSAWSHYAGKQSLHQYQSVVKYHIKLISLSFLSATIFFPYFFTSSRTPRFTPGMAGWNASVLGLKPGPGGSRHGPLSLPQCLMVVL